MSCAIKLTRRTLLGGAGALVAGAPALARMSIPALRGGVPGPTLSEAALLSVWTGAPTPDGVMLSTRLLGDPGEEGYVSIVTATDAALTENVVWHNTVTSSDRIARHTLTGLPSDTQHYYAVALDGVPSGTIRGAFRTLPPAGAPLSFELVAGSCANTGSTHPVFNTARTYRGSPLLMAHVGDLHYMDSTTTNDETRQDLYDMVFASGPQADLYRLVPTAYMTGDHDFCGDASHATSTGRDSAVRAFRARVPAPFVLNGATDPLYYAFDVGRVRLIFTDQRSARTSPTAPDDAAKTMLGATQKAWFKALFDRANPANQNRFYIWFSEVPWTAPVEARDHWGGYSTERLELADHFKAEGWEGLICVVAGDQHGLSIDTGANGDYATGGGMDIPVFQCGGFNRPAGAKGGPYNLGTSFGNVYGRVQIVDTGGSTITVRFYAVSVSSDGTPTVRLDANSDGISHQFTSVAL
ncbi:MAG: alkaline phosphatase D family protein [Alphaproteobacteria bacterium]